MLRSCAIEDPVVVAFSVSHIHTDRLQIDRLDHLQWVLNR